MQLKLVEMMACLSFINEFNDTEDLLKKVRQGAQLLTNFSQNIAAHNSAIASHILRKRHNQF